MCMMSNICLVISNIDGKLTSARSVYTFRFVILEHQQPVYILVCVKQVCTAYRLYGLDVQASVIPNVGNHPVVPLVSPVGWKSMIPNVGDHPVVPLVSPVGWKSVIPNVGMALFILDDAVLKMVASPWGRACVTVTLCPRR